MGMTRAKTADGTLVEDYLGMMRGLRREYRIRIAERLTEELAEEKERDSSRKMNEVDRLYGSWRGEESAEEIIAKIYASRTPSTRDVWFDGW